MGNEDQDICGNWPNFLGLLLMVYARVFPRNQLGAVSLVFHAPRK